jgi:hypothetical protein
MEIPAVEDVRIAWWLFEREGWLVGIGLDLIQAAEEEGTPLDERDAVVVPDLVEKLVLVAGIALIHSAPGDLEGVGRVVTAKVAFMDDFFVRLRIILAEIVSFV